MSFSFRFWVLPVIVVVFPTCAILAESADALIRKGDNFDAKLQAAQALKVYLPARKLQPNNVQLLVHIARQYRHLMSDAISREEKLRLGGIAVVYARRAVAVAPDNSDAQLALAISYAKLVPFQSSREQVEASPRIKEAVDKAIRLDPTNDLAWHVLGRWTLALADTSAIKRAMASLIYGKLPSTTFEQAAQCFERAIKLNPNRLMHYIELGRTYAKMGRLAEARRFINKGLAMPDVEKDDPETKRRGQEVLARL